MRAKHVEQTILTTVACAACVMFFLAAYAASAHAQNPSTSLTLPEQQETPVSPTTPGILPGTTAADTAVGTNPITGQPCIGGGSTAITGGIPGAPTAPDQAAQPGQTVTGLPPNNSVYGINNQLPITSSGAC
jgi:hypothetical protein